MAIDPTKPGPDADRIAARVVDALAKRGYIGSTSHTPSQRLASAKARRALAIPRNEDKE